MRALLIIYRPPLEEFGVPALHEAVIEARPALRRQGIVIGFPDYQPMRVP
jgi:hypothetical protein